MTIDLGKLRLFYIVAQESSVSKAAQRLNTSQPALSEHIMNFEHRLKVKLFKRVPTGMLLTPEGEKLLSYAEEVIRRNEVFSKEFYDQDTLKIITTPFVGSEWLILHLKYFLEEHPQIKARVLLKSDDINPMEGDVAIRTFIPQQLHLIQEHLLTVQVRLFASPEYLMRFGTPRTVEDLENHRLITYRGNFYTPYGSTNWLLNLGIEKRGTPRESHFEVDSLHGMLNSAVHGLGIVELPNYTVVLEKGLVKVLPEIPGPETELYYTYPKSRQKSKKLQALLEYLRKQGK